MKFSYKYISSIISYKILTVVTLNTLEQQFKQLFMCRLYLYFPIIYVTWNVKKILCNE